MSQIMKKAAIMALLSGNVEGVKLQDHYSGQYGDQVVAKFNSQQAMQLVTEGPSMIRENFANAEALQAPNVFQADEQMNKKFSPSPVDKEALSQNRSNDLADEMIHEQSLLSSRQDTKIFSMNEIQDMSIKEPKFNHYQSIAERVTSPAAESLLQKSVPTVPQEVVKQDGPQSGTPTADAVIDTAKTVTGNKDDSKKAQTSESSQDGPQSGTPGADTVLDTFRLISGKDDSKKAQVTESSESDLTETNQAKLEEMMFKQGVDYQKFAEEKAQKFANVQDEQCLPEEYKKMLADKKQAEIQKKEDEKRQKEEAIKKQEEDKHRQLVAEQQKLLEEEQKKQEKEHPKGQSLKQEPPKEDPTGPTMTSVVVNHILNEDDKDDEADIQKVVHRINTDEERFTNAMKSNKD